MNEGNKMLFVSSQACGCVARMANCILLHNYILLLVYLCHHAFMYHYLLSFLQKVRHLLQHSLLWFVIYITVISPCIQHEMGEFWKVMGKRHWKSLF